MKKVIIPILSAIAVASPCTALAACANENTPLSLEITIGSEYNGELSKDGDNRVEIPGFKAVFFDKDGKASDVTDAVYIDEPSEFSLVKQDNKYYLKWSNSIEAKSKWIHLKFAYFNSDTGEIVYLLKNVNLKLTGTELNHSLGTDVDESVGFDESTTKPRYHTSWTAKMKWDDSDIYHSNKPDAYINGQKIDGKYVTWNTNEHTLNVSWEAVTGDVTVNNIHLTQDTIEIANIENTECGYKTDVSIYKTVENSQELKLIDQQTHREIESRQDRPIVWSIVNNNDNWELETRNNKTYLKLKEGWLQGDSLKAISNQHISVNVQATFFGKTLTKSFTYDSYNYDFDATWEGFDQLTNLGRSDEEGGCVGHATSSPVKVKIFDSYDMFKEAVNNNSYTITWEPQGGRPSNILIRIPEQTDISPKIKFSTTSSGDVVIDYPNCLLQVDKSLGSGDYGNWISRGIDAGLWNTLITTGIGSFNPEFTITVNCKKGNVDHKYTKKVHLIKVV